HQAELCVPLGDRDYEHLACTRDDDVPCRRLELQGMHTLVAAGLRRALGAAVHCGGECRNGAAVHAGRDVDGHRQPCPCLDHECARDATHAAQPVECLRVPCRHAYASRNSCASDAAWAALRIIQPAGAPLRATSRITASSPAGARWSTALPASMSRPSQAPSPSIAAVRAASPVTLPRTAASASAAPPTSSSAPASTIPRVSSSSAPSTGPVTIA